MNRPLTFGGEIVVSREGVVQLEPVDGAPTALPAGPRLMLTAPDEAGNRYIELTLSGALAPEIGKVAIRSYGYVGGAAKTCGRTFPAATVTAMKAGGGTFRLPGTADEKWLGALAGTDPTRVEVILKNAAGWGLARNLWAYEPAAPAEVEPFVVTANPVLTGPITAGKPFSYTALQWTGEADVEIVHIQRRAEDGSGTNPGSDETITGITPNVAGALTHMRIEATASGPGVANPATVYPSAWVEITPAETETEVAVDDPPMFAASRLLVKTVTNAAFSPRDTLTAGAATATVVYYEPVTKELFLGPITGGPIADNTPLSSESGGTATANGASAAWALTAGEPIYMLPPTLTGAPTSGPTLVQRIRDDSDDATPTVVEFSGAVPKHYGSMQYQPEWEFSGSGINGVDTVSLDWTNIGIPTLDPLPKSAWIPVVAAEPGGGDRLIEIRVRDDLFSTSAMATTNTDAQNDANPFPAGYELLTYGDTIDVAGVAYRRYAVSPWIHNDIDYSVFGAGATGNEDARRQRLGLVVQIGGAWTPLGERQTVPSIINPPSTAGSFQRLVPRSQEWIEDGESGGTLMQFPRAVDAQGDFLAMGYDVTWPSFSLNFGDNWQSDDCIGLFAQQTFSGLCVDLPYIHVQAGSLFMEGVNDSHADREGTYRKNVNTNQWTWTKQLSKIVGTNAGWTRKNMRYICKVAGSGSGPDTRTLYQIHAPAATDKTFTTIQILRSTAGGAKDSWSNFGDPMYAVDPDGAGGAVGHGRPIELWATSTHLFLNTEKKVRVRLVSTDSWVDATGLPDGTPLHLEVVGTTCYVFVEGKGLSTATISAGSAALAFTQKKAFNGRTFSVSPADPKRIVMVAYNKDVTPIGTHDGGVTWFDIASQPYPGQPEDFEQRLNGDPAWVRFHDTNPNLVFAMRYQHTGKSTDGGRTFVWAARDLDYSEVRSIGSHPTDPLRHFLCMTDKLTVALDGLIALDDRLDGPAKATIKDYINENNTAFTAGGALVLYRENETTHAKYTSYIACVGKNTGTKTPVIANRGTSISFESDKPTTGNGALAYSVTPDLPCGKYRLTCTAAAANGGTFKLVGPINVDMGTFVVGTERTASHPRGGSITITISDGSVDFKAGTKPKAWTILVEPIKTNTILNPSTKGNGYYAGTNPGVSHRGITGRNVFELPANGGAPAIVRSIPYEFMGYMGDDGTVVAASGNSTLMRGNDTGGSFVEWATGAGNFNPMARQVVIGSRHSNQRAWTGTSGGKVLKVQNGAVSTVFSFDAFCTANSIYGDWPGSATGAANSNAARNGPRMIPPCTGLWESQYDPNLLYAAFYTVGAPLTFFRTKTALASKVLSVDNVTNTNFRAGDVLTISGGAGGVVSYFDAAASRLYLESVTGTIADNATITSPRGGAAQADGTPANASPVWENCSAQGLVGWGPIAADVKGRGLLGPIQSLSGLRRSDEPALCGPHGTVLFRPHQAHIDAYGLFSVVDYIRSLPGGSYYNTAKL